jgi:hypothetical protein
MLLPRLACPAQAVSRRCRAVEDQGRVKLWRRGATTNYISAAPQPIGLDIFIIVISCPALEIGKAGGKPLTLNYLDVSKRKSSAYRRRGGLMQKVLTATSTFIFTANLAVTAGMRSQPNSGASSQPALNGSCVTAYHQITLTRVRTAGALRTVLIFLGRVLPLKLGNHAGTDKCKL